MANTIETIHWPQLRRITINGYDAELYYNEYEGLMRGLRIFLSRHTLLEAVSLKRTGFPLDSLPEDSLPKLRSLECDDWGKTVYGRNRRKYTYPRLPQSIARNIHHFRPIIEDEMLDVLKDMAELRTCLIWGVNDIEKLHEYAPKLERLLYFQPQASGEEQFAWGNVSDIFKLIYVILKC